MAKTQFFLLYTKLCITVRLLTKESPYLPLVPNLFLFDCELLVGPQASRMTIQEAL
jgi:hypothetical protein